MLSSVFCHFRIFQTLRLENCIGKKKQVFLLNIFKSSAFCYIGQVTKEMVGKPQCIMPLSELSLGVNQGIKLLILYCSVKETNIYQCRRVEARSIKLCGCWRPRIEFVLWRSWDFSNKLYLDCGYSCTRRISSFSSEH